MTAIIMLTPDERFIQFLDPDLCSITETATTGGLRTIKFEYTFQDYKEDKELFKLGNKLWIQDDISLTDCLYVVNTSVKQDIFKDNSFTLELEEVLVELNNAPLASHLDLSTYSDIFKTKTINGAEHVKIDWNCLNFWFGDFFNMGVVQDCLNNTVQFIPFYGTYNKMNLLRYIEEQTGNVFVTRYEKDLLSNTIHRYLDFLNPLNVSKNWEMHIQYDFLTPGTRKFYDESGNEVPEDKAWEVVRYTNSHVPTGQAETVSEYDPNEEAEILAYDTLDTGYKWIAEDEMVVDEDTIKEYQSIANINPSNIQFQVTDSIGEILTADGTVYVEGDDNPLIWTPDDLAFSAEDTNVLITLSQQSGEIGLCSQNRGFAIYEADYGEGVGDVDPTYAWYQDGDANRICDMTWSWNLREGVIPDDCYFEIYDTSYQKVLFRTCINRAIGTVHEEVLDFGFNLDNIEYDVDEADVYTAVAPVLQLNETNSNGLTRGNFNDLLTRFGNLKINKGEDIPMIMQRITVKAVSLEAAKVSLGSYTALSGADESTSKSNYWIRPYNPQDNIDSQTPANSTFEFLRATANWKAPFRKDAGSLNVILDDVQGIEYPIIFGRADTREAKGTLIFNKVGTTESSDEDIYSIYNQCALYLKDHQHPKIELNVDISNLKNGKFNDYNIHDRVYIKIPETNELITARVVETSKEAHDISANKIKVSNYSTNTIKTIANEIIINASNINYKYPSSAILTARLENLGYNQQDPYSVQYPANKLLQFTTYRVESGNRTFMKRYNKITDAYGYAKLNIKYKPGDYEIDISYGGDEEYGETTTTVKINVSGTIEVKKKANSTSKSKTTKKTTKTVTKTTYYNKYGLSPDKKKILAIGRVSASGDQGSYANFYGMEFKNKCPHCGKSELYWSIFYAGNETGNQGIFPATGRKEGGSAEGHIFCKNCDADYSCQGHEHISGGKSLTVTKKRFKSSKADAYKLKKGKYVYNKSTSTTSSKNNKSTKTRKIIGSPSRKVKQLALKIVGDKTGYKAMRAICDWMDKNIWYSSYGNFCRSPDTVINSEHGNCCDQTRLILQLFDAAGLTEYYELYYVHVTEQRGHVYAQLKSKKTGKRVYVDPASDVRGCYGYVCQGYSHGSPASKYPNMPFR